MTGRIRVALLLLPVLGSTVLPAQSRRLRGADREIPSAPAPDSTPTPAPQAVPSATPPAPSQAAAPATTPTPTPVPAAPAPLAPASEATSLLQQPAQEAQITFVKNQLSIKAENASLSAILHQFAAKSGMTIEGMGGDERVFGTFGPGAARDVLADLLNGTSYNLVLLGTLENGAPRQLILSPAGHSATTASAAPIPQAFAEDNEPEQEPPPPPEPPQQQQPADANQQQNPNGVKTPQQLFEQLQRMRQGQQNGQQQQPVQQDSPQQ
jgi:hypothetical protein